MATDNYSRSTPSDFDALMQVISSLALVEDRAEYQPEAKSYRIDQDDDGGRVVRIAEGDGYRGFFSEFRFDAEGAAIGHRAAE